MADLETINDRTPLARACAKCGSAFWVRETFPDFSILSCFAAAHHLRVGAPAPAVRRIDEPASKASARRGLVRSR